MVTEHTGIKELEATLAQQLILSVMVAHGAVLSSSLL